MRFKIGISLLAGASVLFAQEGSPDHRLRHAMDAFQDSMASPDRGIPRDLFDKSQCVVIVPDLIKGAFLVGGKYGRGFASCRHGNGWSSPAAIRIEGGSFGLQLGGSATDVILLVMNRKGMDHLLGDKFTIGAEAAGAAGPVGRDTTAQTDVVLRAEILSWSRSRGLFAGLSLEGATLRPDNGENRKLYGREISNREILETGVRTPKGARSFVAMLDGYAGGVPATEASLSKQFRETGKVVLSDKQIHFATGQWAIPGGSDATLAEIAQVLKDNPDWHVRIEGYTDNVGSKESNLKLSQERADSVMRWLEDHGVDQSRLRAKGYGKSRFVEDNATEAGRAQNRRVEILRADVKG